MIITETEHGGDGGGFGLGFATILILQVYPFMFSKQNHT